MNEENKFKYNKINILIILLYVVLLPTYLLCGGIFFSNIMILWTLKKGYTKTSFFVGILIMIPKILITTFFSIIVAPSDLLNVFFYFYLIFNPIITIIIINALYMKKVNIIIIACIGAFLNLSFLLFLNFIVFLPIILISSFLIGLLDSFFCMEIPVIASKPKVV